MGVRESERVGTYEWSTRCWERGTAVALKNKTTP